MLLSGPVIFHSHQRVPLLLLLAAAAEEPSGFLPVQHSARSRGHSSDPLLDRSAGSKTDPIEMTVIDRALCAVDLARYLGTVVRRSSEYLEEGYGVSYRDCAAYLLLYPLLAQTMIGQ